MKITLTAMKHLVNVAITLHIAKSTGGALPTSAIMNIPTSNPLGLWHNTNLLARATSATTIHARMNTCMTSNPQSSQSPSALR